MVMGSTSACKLLMTSWVSTKGMDPLWSACRWGNSITERTLLSWLSGLSQKKRGSAMAGWNPQLARGDGSCQMLLNLTVLHSHCMSLADRVFSFNGYLGAKCSKYLRQMLLLTLIIHHCYCYYSTPQWLRSQEASEGMNRPHAEQAQQGRYGPKNSHVVCSPELAAEPS